MFPTAIPSEQYFQNLIYFDRIQKAENFLQIYTCFIHKSTYLVKKSLLSILEKEENIRNINIAYMCSSNKNFVIIMTIFSNYML